MTKDEELQQVGGTDCGEPLWNAGPTPCVCHSSSSSSMHGCIVSAVGFVLCSLLSGSKEPTHMAVKSSSTCAGAMQALEKALGRARLHCNQQGVSAQQLGLCTHKRSSLSVPMPHSQAAGMDTSGSCWQGQQQQQGMCITACMHGHVQELYMRAVRLAARGSGHVWLLLYSLWCLVMLITRSSCGSCPHRSLCCCCCHVLLPCAVTTAAAGEAAACTGAEAVHHTAQDTRQGGSCRSHVCVCVCVCVCVDTGGAFRGPSVGAHLWCAGGGGGMQMLSSNNGPA
jgi:hypothetical protein